MKARARTVLLWVGLSGLAAGTSAEKLRSHFDFDALLGQPAFFDFAVLGEPAPARWIVLADDTAPSPPKAAAQVLISRPDGSIAAALRRRASLRDGSWSVSIKQVPAHAGLVFRMEDEKNFLLLLVDGATGHARLQSYRDGQGSELASGRATFNTAWGRLGVTADGAKIAATWDDKPLLEATDPRPASGRAGMATAGAGSASFDELLIEPASPQPGHPR
jgi:hypothetical protein